MNVKSMTRKSANEARLTSEHHVSLSPMSDDEIQSAALTDPDSPLLTPERLTRLQRVPKIKTLRRALDLTQEEFSKCYQIPLGTLRDWEQGRSEPDAPARAFLRAIAGAPDAVRRALMP